MTAWGPLLAKAVVSGLLIATASEIARRSPGWGGLIAALPLTSLLALAWLWHDAPDPARAADFIAATGLYVLASLPAFALVALLLRRGAGIGPAMVAGSALAIAGTYAMNYAGRRWGWPV